MLAQIFLTLAKMGLVYARMGEGGRGVACVTEKKVWYLIKYLNFCNLPEVVGRAEKKISSKVIIFF